MKSRFALIVESPTAEEKNAITAFLKNKVGYWHWLQDLWLIVDSKGKWTTRSLRDEIVKLAPGKYLMIFKIDDGKAWSGFGPEKMFPWLRSTWIDSPGD